MYEIYYKIVTQFFDSLAVYGYGLRTLDTLSQDQDYPNYRVSIYDPFFQNIVQLHEKAAAITVGHVICPTIEAPPSGIYFSNFRKRGRKPDKSEICHLVSMTEPKGAAVSLSEIVLPENKTVQFTKEQFSLPKLSEVTITPAILKFERSPSPEIVEIPVSKMSSVKFSPPPKISSASTTITQTSVPRQPGKQY